MDKLITRKEAASILGISVKTLDAARTDGLISFLFGVFILQEVSFLCRELLPFLLT